MTNLVGEIALVTGASRGIGQAVASELLRRGASVIGTATTSAGSEAISSHLQRLGNGGGRGLVLDVNDPEAIQAALADIGATEGSPTLLVNNAGVTRDNLLARLSEDDWDTVIDTNLKSIYRLCKAAIRPMMKARRGRIINITSVVASQGNAGQTNYAASKAGIIGFTRALAREVGGRGVTVNAVAPGFIDTDMTRALSDEQRTALLSTIPLNRLGEGQEIAAAVAFLASPDSGYITGQTLHVNGGMYMG